MKLLVDIENFFDYLNKITFNSLIKSAIINLKDGKLSCVLLDTHVGTQIKKENDIFFNEDGSIFKDELKLIIGNHIIFKKYLQFLESCLDQDSKFIKCEFEDSEQIESIRFYEEKNDIGFTFYLNDSLDGLDNQENTPDDLEITGLNKLCSLNLEKFVNILKNLKKAPGKNIKIYSKKGKIYIGFFYEIGSFIEYLLVDKTNVPDKVKISFNLTIFKIMSILNEDEYKNYTVDILYLPDEDNYYGTIIISKNSKNKDEIERYVIISLIE